MVFVIDQITINASAKKVLSEIDSMIAFTGKRPAKVALFPAQFSRVKRGALVALRKKIRNQLKDSLGGGKRLPRGELDYQLKAAGYGDNEKAELIQYNGIILYDKSNSNALNEQGK